MATSMKSRFYAWQIRLRSIMQWRNVDGCQFSSRSYYVRSHLMGKTHTRSKYPVIISTVFSSALIMQTSDKEEKIKEKESPVITMFKLARLAQMKQDGEKAVSYLHKALIAADNEFKHDRMSKKDYTYARVNVFDSLANIALSQGEFTKAEKLFKETMKGCLEVGLDKTDNAIIEISIKLASIYAMQKREDEAVKGYEYAIEIQNQKLSDNPDSSVDTRALLGMALEAYGRYLLYHKQLDQSLNMLSQAVDIAKLTIGESGMQTLVLMNDLATVHILRKDFNKAEEVLKHAIKIGDNVESTHCPALYCNLGAVYLRKSQLSDTESACKHGLKLAQRYKDNLAIEQAKKCLKKVKEVKQKGIST